jgi:hypothetical protein
LALPVIASSHPTTHSTLSFAFKWIASLRSQ